MDKKRFIRKLISIPSENEIYLPLPPAEPPHVPPPHVPPPHVPPPVAIDFSTLNSMLIEHMENFINQTFSGFVQEYKEENKKIEQKIKKLEKRTEILLSILKKKNYVRDDSGSIETSSSSLRRVSKSFLPKVDKSLSTTDFLSDSDVRRAKTGDEAEEEEEEKEKGDEDK